VSFGPFKRASSGKLEMILAEMITDWTDTSLILARVFDTTARPTRTPDARQETSSTGGCQLQLMPSTSSRR
jgi:hypothetical protein